MLNYDCSECEHIFRAELIITHTLYPSRTPNAEVNLPFLGCAHDNDNGRLAAQAR